MSELNVMEAEICGIIGLRNPVSIKDVQSSYARFKSFDNVLAAIDCAIATNTALDAITELMLQIDENFPSSCAACGTGSPKICLPCAAKAIKKRIRSPQLKP